jgi:hypothetical protein
MIYRKQCDTSEVTVWYERPLFSFSRKQLSGTFSWASLNGMPIHKVTTQKIGTPLICQLDGTPLLYITEVREVMDEKFLYL